MGILVAAPVVALSAKQIADASGVEETFIGTTLLAVTTCCPSLVVALAAVRIEAHDLAVGNLFGSNAANMAVLLVLDIAYPTARSWPRWTCCRPPLWWAPCCLHMALAVAALVGGTETCIRRPSNPTRSCCWWPTSVPSSPWPAA
ncbi:MAG: hypothetical protein R2755_05565 [Acidimicrobiales bacterium]